MTTLKRMNLWENFDQVPQFLPKQRAFLNSEKKFVLYIGGMGSGKSVALCAWVLKMAFKFPGTSGLLGRKFYPDLRDSTMEVFFEFCPEWAIKKYYKQDKKVVFINGSVLYFKQLDNFDPKLKSLNIAWAAIDEADENPKELFEFLTTRIRKKIFPAPSRRIAMVTNPNGHDWIWQLFTSDPDTRLFEEFRAPTQENVHLPDDYIATMRAVLPPDMQRRYIDADSNVRGGLVYPEFRRETHVVDGSLFKIPPDWLRGRALDHGLHNPTCCLWYAVSPDGIIYFYREYYERGRVIKENVKDILRLSGDEVYHIPTYIDPACAAKSAISGSPLIEHYYESGLEVIVAPQNDVSAGINRVNHYMKVNERLQNPVTGKPGSPLILVDQSCKSFIWEIEKYMWKKLRVSTQRNAPETPNKMDDHAMDCMRYIVLARPERWELPKEKPWWQRVSEEQDNYADPELGSEF